MKNYWATAFLFLMLVAGLFLMLYPSFANWWNSFTQSQAIDTYAKEVANMDEDTYAEMWDAAWEYNQSLTCRPNSFVLSDKQKQIYHNLLNIGGNGIMGYIEIPSIDVILPVYHGTDEAVLQVAVGHLEWSSLPVGGKDSHCVISGHRGLPSARLFTDLDQIVLEDIFTFHILDELLTYEVDQIRIVEPHETQNLMIEEGEDLCTLITCTPYGVNSHRLLIRGRRIEKIESEKFDYSSTSTYKNRKGRR